MGELRSGREYTSEELHAAKVLRLAGFDNLVVDSGRGPLYFATGEFWIEKVEVYGAKYEAAARAASILLDAMRREFGRWPVATDADSANRSAARQQREAARKRIAELNAEMTHLITVSTNYAPGEPVLISHPTSPISGTIVKLLPDGYTYLIDTEFGQVEMEARYLTDAPESGAV